MHKSNRFKIAAVAALSAVFGTSAMADYVWTGDAGDNLYFTAGNWADDHAPTNEPDEDVVIDGTNLDEARRLVLYAPGGDFKPQKTVTVKGGATWRQISTSSWIQAQLHEAKIIVDGGTFDMGPSSRFYPYDLVVQNGGVITNSVGSSCPDWSKAHDITVTGGYVPVSQGEYTMTDIWHISGGYIDNHGGWFNVPARSMDFGSAMLCINGTRIGWNSSVACRYNFAAGGIILGSQGVYQGGGSYINVDAGSTARFTYPYTSDKVYANTFGTSTSTPKYRFKDAVITEAEFTRYFEMESYTYGNGTAGTTFHLRDVPMFADDGSIYSEDGADFTATVDLEQVALAPTDTKLYICYGAEDGGETVDGWTGAYDAATVTTAGTYEITLPHTLLAQATTYQWRVIAVNEKGSAATAAQSFTTGEAAVCTDLALTEATEADALFSVNLASGDIATIKVVVTDGAGNVHTAEKYVRANGTYSLLVEGLAGATAYTWKVEVANGWGSSTVEAGDALAFTTPAACSARTAIASGLWNDPANWDPTGVPKAGNAVTIPAGLAITNTIETSTVDSLLVGSGASLVFSGWDAHLRVAGGVVVNGTLSHVVNSATAANDDGSWTPNGRVNISCANFVLGAAGKVNVKGCGYQGSVLNSSAAGFGPGRGLYTGMGASHGGRPGACNAANWAFQSVGGHIVPVLADVYDSETEPSEPGSGAFSQDRKWGGNGGGVVRIVATGDVTVDGTINADGTTIGNEYGYSNHWTAGSGGSVYIKCRALLGSGTISANGGNSRYQASGAGGGRVAVAYNTAAQAAVNTAVHVQAMGGGATFEHGMVYKNSAADGYRDNFTAYGRAFYGIDCGEPGTLWFPDSQLLTRAIEEGVVRYAGRWTAPNPPTAIDVDGDLVFEDGGLALDTISSITVGGDLKLLGHNTAALNGMELQTLPNQFFFTNCVLAVDGSLIASNAMLRLTAATTVDVGGDLDAYHSWIGVLSDGTTCPQVTIGGDATLSKTTRLVVSAGDEDRTDVDSVETLLASGGALVSVAGDLTMSSYSTITPICQPVSGGAPWFSVGSATVDATSGFEATGLGYETYANIRWNGKWPGLPTSERYARGLGGGAPTTITAIGSKYAGAGGYGGNGGNATNINDVAYGMAYDSPYAPFGPGSTGPNGESVTASGSGSIRLFSTGDVTFNGVMSTRGLWYKTNWSYAASGGAIWVICRNFSGGEKAYLDVRGGSGGGNGSPGGGGGRISVWTCRKPAVLDGKVLEKLIDGDLATATLTSAEADGWLGTVNVSAGVSDVDGNTITITQPEDGTATFLSVPTERRGAAIILR